MRKVLALIASLYLMSDNVLVAGGNGGGIAAGVLGGFGAGAILGAVISSHSHRPREVIYTSQYPAYNNYQSNYFQDWQNNLNQREQNLLEKERDLNRLERRLSKKAKNISRERSYQNRNMKFSNSNSQLTQIEPDIEKKPIQSHRKIKVHDS